jgi:pilus assembly protein Flp/PilA
MKKLIRFLKDEEGVTAIEYGLIAVLIALSIIVGAGLVGTWLDNTFTYVSNQAPAGS